MRLSIKFCDGVPSLWWAVKSDTVIANRGLSVGVDLRSFWMRAISAGGFARPTHLPASEASARMAAAVPRPKSQGRGLPAKIIQGFCVVVLDSAVRLLAGVAVRCTSAQLAKCLELYATGTDCGFAAFTLFRDRRLQCRGFISTL